MRISSAARRVLWSITLALACGSAAAQGAPGPIPPIPQGHDGLVIGGVFDIRYVPVMCIRAPCPPGRYAVTLEGQRIGAFSTLIVTTTTDGQDRATRYEGRFLEGSGRLEGLLRIERDTAHLDLLPMTAEPAKP
jgi:hypothetical protein